MRLVVADCDRSCTTFVDHSEVLEEGPADQSGVGLSTVREMHTRESSGDSEFQIWNVNLSEMNVYFARSLHPGNRPLVNYG